MTFSQPAFLPLGAAVALLVVLGLWRHAVRRRRLASFLGGTPAVRRLSGSDLHRLRVERMLLVGGVCLAIAAAAAEPRWAVSAPPAPPRTVVIAIDVSASMQAADVAPNRLARAVGVAEELIGALEDQRVGLLLFSGSAYPLAPPTFDRGVVRRLLSGVTTTTASAHDPGTLMEVGLEEAATLSTGDQERAGERWVVLIGDGDTQESAEALQSVARAIVDRGVRIHTIGVGTAEGGALQMPRAPYQLGGPVLDERGAPARSRLDGVVLERIAEEGRGSYANADDGPALADVHASFERAVSTSPWWLRYDLASLLVLLALAGLLAESLLELRLPMRRVAQLRRGAA